MDSRTSQGHNSFFSHGTVSNEDLASEIMEEDLPAEIRQEVEALRSRQPIPLDDINNIHFVAEKPPFWKRKWFVILAILLFVAAIAAIVGVLVVGNDGNGGEKATGLGKGPTATESGVPTMSPVIEPTLRPSTNNPTSVGSTPTLSPTVSLLGQVQVSALETFRGTDIGGRFGVSAVLSGDGKTMVVGAINVNTVTTFRRSGDNQWSRLEQVLRGSGSFGCRLDLSEDGTILVVGARSNSDGGESAGQVQTFRMSSNNEWKPHGSPINGLAPGDQFGWAVALSNSGRTMAVSARLGDPSSDRVNAGYVRVFTWSGGWIGLGQVLEGDVAMDQFGRSIALDSAGRRLAVGILNGGRGTGRTKVFDFFDGSWNSVGQPLDGEAPEGGQGSSVALSSDGSILAVGAEGDDTTGTLSGAVRVYELLDRTWVQRGQTIFGKGGNGQLGAGHISISNDGNLLAAGAQNINVERGEAYLFRYSGVTSQWEQVAEYAGDDEGDGYGASVNLSGDGSVFVVGAPDNAAGSVGLFSVSIFTPPPTKAPTLTPVVDPSTPVDVSVMQTLRGLDQGGRFGVDVAISRDGTTMAVGAINRNTVITYRRVGSQWNRLGQVLRGSGSFGGRVDLSRDGTILVVGARSTDVGGEDAGQARAFILREDAWISRGSPINGRAAGDQFGWDVSTSDDGLTIAVAARLGDPSRDRVNAGYARIFKWNDSDWSQLGQDLRGEVALDSFGRAIALDSAGRRVAVGIVNGAGGAGRVRVYDYLNGDWSTVGQPLDGVSFEDFQGTSVALSKDGSVLAVGADGNDAKGSDSGMVRVYELSGSTWIQRGQTIFGRGSFGQLGAGHVSLSDDGTLLAAGAQDLDDERGAAYLFRYSTSTSQWMQVAEFNGDSVGDDFGESVCLDGEGRFFAVSAPDNGVGYVRVYVLD